MPIHDPDEDDPMEFTGVLLPGDSTDAMAETFVEEYMLMGWTDEKIFELFRDRFYMATHRVLRVKGEAWVRELIRRVRSGGAPSADVRIVEAPRSRSFQV
jgi:hypothetical protein